MTRTLSRLSLAGSSWLRRCQLGPQSRAAGSPGTGQARCPRLPSGAVCGCVGRSDSNAAFPGSWSVHAAVQPAPVPVPTHEQQGWADPGQPWETELKTISSPSPSERPRGWKGDPSPPTRQLLSNHGTFPPPASWGVGEG